MTSQRYLEIDSTYRDRSAWPNIGYFQIPISQSGRKGRYDAVDPVTNGIPDQLWTPNRVNMSTNSNVVTGVIDSIGAPNNIAATTDGTVLIITSTAGNLQKLIDYYINLVFEDTTLSPTVLRRIIRYQYLGTDSGGVNDRAQIILDRYLPDTFNLGDSWAIHDPTDISNPNNPLFFVPSGDLQENAYSNALLYNETLQQYRAVKDYDIDTHILTLDTLNDPISGWTLTQNYVLRYDLPKLTTTITAVTSTSQITINSLTSSDNLYQGLFLRILPGTNPYLYNVYTQGNSSNYNPTSNLTAPYDQTRRISISTSGATTTINVSPPFTVAPSVGMTVEILNFAYDNLCPFTYTGSLVSQQEMVCYEVELISLILPNVILQGGLGAKISKYPYVYVGLQNVSSSGAGLRNIIYSNNPSANNSLFRVPISDITQTGSSAFVKLNGNGMVQTIKFKPNDNLLFFVTYPNGELFNTLSSQRFSPYPPNFIYQLSAMFSLKRI
jgi:hypothetical protein